MQYGFLGRDASILYKRTLAFLQAQLGNPEGASSPIKNIADPRVWLRKAEEMFIKRLEVLLLKI